MSMIINYFYENFSSEGKTLNDTLFLSFSCFDAEKKPLQKPLLPQLKDCCTKIEKEAHTNKFNIEGC